MKILTYNDPTDRGPNERTDPLAAGARTARGPILWKTAYRTGSSRDRLSIPLRHTYY